MNRSDEGTMKETIFNEGVDEDSHRRQWAIMQVARQSWSNANSHSYLCQPNSAVVARYSDFSNQQEKPRAFRHTRLDDFRSLPS